MLLVPLANGLTLYSKELELTHLNSVLIALELPPPPQLNKQECPSWTYLALGDGPQNPPLLGIIVYLFKTKVILLKIFKIL